MEYLAFASWALGEIERAVSLVKDMRTPKIAGLTHVNTLAAGTMHAALFELMRGNRSRARTDILELVGIVRKHDLPRFRTYGSFLEGWATAEDGALADGLQSMRRSAGTLHDQGILVFDGLIKIALADVEARTGNPGRALTVLEESLAIADRLNYRAFEAELQRARGEMLLKRDPANPAPAEEAFLTAIAVAKQQGARSFELRAALALAKLYQSTGRPAEAHAILAPALQGFLPTPEMPEIAEAQALLAAVARDGTRPRPRAAQRQRADAAARGLRQRARRGARLPGAETTRSLRKSPRSRRPASKDAPNDSGGRLRPMGRQLRAGRVALDAGAAAAVPQRRRGDGPIRPRPASRIASLGTTAGSPASIASARHHLGNVRSPCSNPAATTIWPFTSDWTPASRAMAYLAIAVVASRRGRSRRSRSSNRMQTRIARPRPRQHARAWRDCYAAVFAIDARRPSRAPRRTHLELARIADEHDLPIACGVRRVPRRAGVLRVMRRAGRAGSYEHAPTRRAACASRTSSSFDGLLKIALAEAEARGGRSRRAPSDLRRRSWRRATAQGYRAFEAELHRVRGEILLKARSGEPCAWRKQAFLTAIAVARQQGTRSFELRAALALAQALSVDRPPRRGLRRACARA